jgi:hypothetical protein
VIGILFLVPFLVRAILRESETGLGQFVRTACRSALPISASLAEAIWVRKLCATRIAGNGTAASFDMTARK